MKGLFCDLSLSGAAFAVLSFSGNTATILETVFVNNKKNAKKGTGYRLDCIATAMADVLKRHPDVAAVVRERGFSRFNGATQALFRVVGVADLTMHRAGMTVELGEIPPSTIKLLVAGHGHAEKADVAAALRAYLKPSQQAHIFKTDDESDAVAVGIAWGLQNNLLIPVTNADKTFNHAVKAKKQPITKTQRGTK